MLLSEPTGRIIRALTLFILVLLSNEASAETTVSASERNELSIMLTFLTDTHSLIECLIINKLSISCQSILDNISNTICHFQNLALHIGPNALRLIAVLKSCSRISLEGIIGNHIVQDGVLHDETIRTNKSGIISLMVIASCERLL